MANDIYSAIFDGINKMPIEKSRIRYRNWAAVETDIGMGICMYVDDVDCHKFALANSYYNRGSAHYEPFENYCTKGVDFWGKTVGVVGHLGGVKSRHSSEYKKCYMFDFEPKVDEDLDPVLEDEFLPLCDIVVITGSSIVNGTLPHVLELCRKAYTIIVGPSTPQCEALLDFGIDRLSGLIPDAEKLREYFSSGQRRNIYTCGHAFMISK